jgi:AraC-like DNA-binding protein
VTSDVARQTDAAGAPRRSGGRWRTTARLAAALPLLAAGTPVATTAHQVGYATPSAFVAAFRREIGTTPADYFRSP